MRHAPLFVALFLLICGPLRAARAENLTRLLSELRVRRNVMIAFSHVQTDPVVVANPSYEGEVAQILERWLEGTGLRFRDLGGNYYIYRVEGPVVGPWPRATPTPRTAVKKPVRPASRPVPVRVRRSLHPPVLDDGILFPQRRFQSAGLKPLPVPPPPMVQVCEPPFSVILAVKTNLLYDATSTLNLGFEAGLGQRWTLDVSGNFNPWTFSDNRKMKHWLVQPEVRWWSCRRFSGHFLGVHLHAGEYNWGGMLPWGIRSKGMRSYRYQGWLAGAGISYGYHWVLGNRWGVEATLGAGFAYLDYEKYPCTRCGRKVGSGSEHYFGPTKAGISLVYILK